MKVWLPCVRGGSGVDIYTLRLKQALELKGISVTVSFYAHYFQYVPWLLKLIKAPKNCDVILANSWNAFAFKQKGRQLVVINHLCVFDEVLDAYKSIYQKIFHQTLVYYFEKNSYRCADKVIAVSQYTANKVAEKFKGISPQAIYNGIDVSFFKPNDKQSQETDYRILFVGNLSRRKGIDLLPLILNALGDNYHLYFTTGLRDDSYTLTEKNSHSLGKLDQQQILTEYQKADVVLFPTRAEGFGYVAVEAMACGTPVVASSVTSLPELIDDGVSSYLCSVDDVDCFVKKIKMICEDKIKQQKMVISGRKLVENKFSFDVMSDEYISIFKQLLNQ